MRHRKSGAKLGRTSSHRKAMFRNMVTSLFKYDSIKTTDAKAKELRGWADHIITLAKRGDLHARRQALSIVREKNIVHKLFEEAAGRYGNIPGGYTRIIKLGARPGDTAPVSLIELVHAEKSQIRKAPKPSEPQVSAPVKTEEPVSEKPEVQEPETEAETEQKADSEASVSVESEENPEAKIEAKIDSQDLKEKEAKDADDNK